MTDNDYHREETGTGLRVDIHGRQKQPGQPRLGAKFAESLLRKGEGTAMYRHRQRQSRERIEELKHSYYLAP